jgi:prolycopene isomerase
MTHYDTLIIGAGLSGLTAAALLSKRGQIVAIFEKTFKPGGSCGIFKRGSTTFDQGSAMIYGFGEKGFNPHRFVFNCLEEPIDIIKHDQLYAVVYKGQRIRFYDDIDLFTEELSGVFPSERDNIKRFYHDFSLMYTHVMIENTTFSSPDEADKIGTLKKLLHRPLSHIRFLSYLNRDTKSLLKKYFKSPEIFQFFDKLTSTYCYTTVEETPAILSAIMFVDNHFGGSYYPAGSTLFLPGKLEKSIEEHNGEFFYENEVRKILFDQGKPIGVEVMSGERFYANDIIYSGTVWNLYEKLIDPEYLTQKEIEWAKNLVPTYPSVVLYSTVDKSLLPDDTLPIEMLIGNPEKLDESEVTLYMLSIDDHSVCDDDVQIITAIGPSFENWKDLTQEGYIKRKELEKERLFNVIENRFPGYRNALKYAELATPLTIERYCNKNNGSVAGPKQMIGQHMFNRLHIRSKWDTFFCCGESTIMGTGTPAVTVSAISAANAVLKKYKLEPFVYRKNMTNYVRTLPKPFTKADLYADAPAAKKEIMLLSSRCLYCDNPTCMDHTLLDIRGINRRISAGNFTGAVRLLKKHLDKGANAEKEIINSQHDCILNLKNEQPVEIKKSSMD